MTADYTKGIKKEVAEIKFLIHDLRVERFINEIIHFHVTVNTDLEIHSIEQAQLLHSDDLQILKKKAVDLRRAFQDYSRAVKNFSPSATVLKAGNYYVETIFNTCDLILNPHWGRIDKVLKFLPPESRSVRSRDVYRNSIQWIWGVSRRIRHFLDEKEHEDVYVYEEFDIADELENFTGDVIAGYVREKGGEGMKLQLDQLDSAVIGGNRYRFRRMYFNLVMNSVDAMANRKVGVLNISDSVEGDRVVLRVRDNGVGMGPEKIEQLLKERKTLDGELHSLGFVFVRQTIAEFGGQLSIESDVGEGTTMAVRFPRLPDKETSSNRRSRRNEDRLPSLAARAAKDVTASTVGGGDAGAAAGMDLRGAATSGAAVASVGPPSASGEAGSYGGMIEEDYRNSDAQPRGSIFGMAVAEDDTIEFFTHRPYDRYANITHEDLSPMCFEAIMRGRLEEDELGRPMLTFKEPQSVREYFEFKNLPEQERSPARHVQMVRDEYIRIARKLIETGMSPETRAELTGLHKFFPEKVELAEAELFSLEQLASQALTTETGE
jgi:signal transduction histidine kinase